MMASILAALSAAALAACFGAPQPVRIQGWTADAMEPFVSRDGQLLFFNSSNAGPRTDIYWARRIDDLHFSLVGLVRGANSPALNGVPSLARDGAFSMISPRAYDASHATLWIGRWTGQAVENLQLQTGLAPPRAGWFNMDAELSADGQRLYFTDNLWRPGGPPKLSYFRMARPAPAGWRVDPSANAWFSRINGDGLPYAAGVSGDDLEFFFTRLTLGDPRRPWPQIMVATRPGSSEPFSAPAPIAALDGFVEAPSVAPDGALYFHKKLAGRFVIMRSARACASSGR